MNPEQASSHECGAPPSLESPGVDFFVSYTATDRVWAEWIAWQLEEQGYRVVIQAWDFRPGSDFITKMRDATAKAKRTIAVLSPAYMSSPFALAEWNAAFSNDPTGEAQTLVPVRVGDVLLEGLDRTRVYVDLVGLDEAGAQQALLEGVRQQRAKPPAAPVFPAHSAPAAPRFPGALPPIWGVPHHANPNFTGREKQLSALAKALTTIPRVVAIVGLGGVGKTQLATEYAYQTLGQFDVVWWVRAEESATAVRRLRHTRPVPQPPRSGRRARRSGGGRTGLARAARSMATHSRQRHCTRHARRGSKRRSGTVSRDLARRRLGRHRPGAPSRCVQRPGIDRASPAARR